jgi:hypothetical protein
MERLDIINNQDCSDLLSNFSLILLSAIYQISLIVLFQARPMISSEKGQLSWTGKKNREEAFASPP